MSASPTAQNYFHFLHDCFEADSSRMIIRSVFQSKYKFRRILSGKEELLEQRLSFAPFDHPDAEKVEKELFTHRLEKSLYYGSIFVLGKHKSGFNPNTNIASPLLLIPIKIKGEEEKIARRSTRRAQSSRASLHSSPWPTQSSSLSRPWRTSRQMVETATRSPHTIPAT